jgi:hypothetical protein
MFSKGDAMEKRLYSCFYSEGIGYRHVIDNCSDDVDVHAITDDSSSV